MAQRVVIVTGASRGIGLAVTNLLLKSPQSCNILAIARSRDALEKLKSEHASRIETLAGDLSDLSLGKKAVDAAISKWGRLDGLVINHGMIEPVAKISDLDLEEAKKSFDVNVFSAIAMVKAAIPELRKTNGKIILTSSGAAVKATTAWGAYGAGKAVLNHLALTLAAEEPDITTVAIRPGVVNTQMQDTLAKEHYGKMKDEEAQRFKDMRKEGKMLKPEQPGNVIARLVVDAPNNMSGSFLNWNDESLAKFQDE